MVLLKALLKALLRAQLKALLTVCLLVGTLATAGCSIVLDPDQIDAVRQSAADTEATGEVVTEVVGEVVTPDTTPDSTVDTPVDTTPDSIADTTPAETSLVIVVHYQGEGGCTLDYKIAPITSFPETCPAGGWSLVFDASGTVGTHTYDWRFSATENYRIGTRNVSGARATVKVDVPSGELLAGAAVGPAKVLAELSVDGDTYALVATLDFSVRQVTTCGGSSGDCPGP